MQPHLSAANAYLAMMEELMKQIILRVVIALVAALALASCSATAAVPPASTPDAGTGAGSATQTNEGGEVTVTATWAGQAAGPVFMVELNTHSVELDAIDLSKLATLHVDGVSVPATGWDAPIGSHHRSGTLTFPTTSANGSPIIGPQTPTVELIIRDVAGVPERTFRWSADA
jgi:hypothetical protein